MLTEESVGSTLRRLRLSAKLGIKSVGPRVGVSYSYLSKIENGKKLPSVGLITELCKLYGADPDDIIAKTGALPHDITEIIQIHGKDAYELLRQTYTETD